MPTPSLLTSPSAVSMTPRGDATTLIPNFQGGRVGIPRQSNPSGAAAGMAMNVCQRLLGYTEESPLNFEREPIQTRLDLEVDGNSATLAKTFDILGQYVSQPEFT